MFFSVVSKDFFSIFISVFLWLGFWLKLNASLIFNHGRLFEPVGFFDYSATNYDATLLVAILGCSGVFFASLINFYSSKASNLLPTYDVDKRRYFIIWVVLALFLCLVCYINLKYSIYQKATRELYLLPTSFTLLIKWMLFIGFEIAFLSLLNIGALLKNRNLHFYLAATLFFSFLINIVTLSRAFPLVGLVILFLMHLLLGRLKIKWRKSRWFLVASTYLFLSVSSILLVSAYRANFFENNQTVLHQNVKINADTKPSAGWYALVFGRWIGFEGVASTVSYPGIGIPLLFDSMKEIKSYGAPSFYDRVVVAEDSTYLDIAQRNYYAITLPGIIGYLNYSGISLIVFLGTFLVSFFSFRFLRYIELYSNNFMVGGFCAYLLAYRLVSFGYVPMDTYLFLLALVAGVVWSVVLKKIICIKSNNL
jgi:hypothetical protein